jgi:hypothetical protein
MTPRKSRKQEIPLTPREQLVAAIDAYLGTVLVVPSDGYHVELEALHGFKVRLKRRVHRIRFKSTLSVDYCDLDSTGWPSVAQLLAQADAAAMADPMTHMRSRYDEVLRQTSTFADHPSPEADDMRSGEGSTIGTAVIEAVGFDDLTAEPVTCTYGLETEYDYPYDVDSEDEDDDEFGGGGWDDDEEGMTFHIDQWVPAAGVKGKVFIDEETLVESALNAPMGKVISIDYGELSLLVPDGDRDDPAECFPLDSPEARAFLEPILACRRAVMPPPTAP